MKFKRKAERWVFEKFPSLHKTLYGANRHEAYVFWSFLETEITNELNKCVIDMITKQAANENIHQ
jgi:hypothetical protein